MPPAYTVDANGKPLHSWRTLLLPYLDEAPLYKTIDLSKAWDAPVNAEICKTTPSVFKCPEADYPEGHTKYLAVVATGGCFLPTKSRHFSEITDDRSKTLMVIEVSALHAVPWMAPIDADEQLVLSLGPKTGVAHSGGMHAAFVDGHVEFLAADMPVGERRARISIAGNDE